MWHWIRLTAIHFGIPNHFPLEIYVRGVKMMHHLMDISIFFI